MKTKNSVLNLLFLSLTLTLLGSGCASTPSEKALTAEARTEKPIESGKEANESLSGLIESSRELSAQEKQELSKLIDHVYQETASFDVLTNQKKTLLIKELLQAKPDRAKINALQSSIRNVQKKRTAHILTAIDKMCRVVKLHPEMMGPFSEKLMNADRFR